MAWLLFLALGLPLMAPGADDGATGTIAGRVEVRLPASPPRSRPAVREMEGRVRRGIPDRRQSVVYLATAPQRAFEERPREQAVLDQRRETFVPYVLPILVGTTVSFPNNDPFYHNVFSLSKTARFDLGRYPMGRTKTVRFDRSGIVRVFCEIHSHMSAFILVLTHQYFAATGGQRPLPDRGRAAGRVRRRRVDRRRGAQQKESPSLSRGYGGARFRGRAVKGIER